MSYLAKTPEGLLPCPHCGGEAEARDGSSTRPYIRCKSCGCRTGASYDMDKLKEAWNRRAEHTCRVKLNENRDVGEPAYICTSCGALMEDKYVFIDDVDGGVREFRFCPNCGEKVVR